MIVGTILPIHFVVLKRKMLPVSMTVCLLPPRKMYIAKSPRISRAFIVDGVDWWRRSVEIVNLWLEFDFSGSPGLVKPRFQRTIEAQ